MRSLIQTTQPAKAGTPMPFDTRDIMEFLEWAIECGLSNLPRVNTVRRAVIDVGTNSIKLLVAEVSGGEVRPLLEESKQTRLGQDFYQTHRLQAPAIAASAQAVAHFADIAREQQVATIRVVATSAARDAINSVELTEAIESASRLKVE